MWLSMFLLICNYPFLANGVFERDAKKIDMAETSEMHRISLHCKLIITAGIHVCAFLKKGY